jgi:hypothetical protein
MEKQLKNIPRGMPLKVATEENTSDEQSSGIFIVGTQIGQCQICKQTKKILLLRFGFSLCKDCLHALTNILEKLQQEKTGLEASKLIIKKTGGFPGSSEAQLG